MRVLREPILHFVLLGLLVFAVHGALQPEARDGRGITLDARKRIELEALFELRQHKKPSADEQEQLAARWVDDEVLFREALDLGLSQRDGAIRELMVAQMRSLLQRSIELPRPSEAQLRSFYDAHHAAYAQPERVSFSEYLIPASASSEDEARRLFHALAAGQPVELPASEYHARSEAQLTQLHPELGSKIFALEAGKWHLLRSARGLHLVRVEARAPARQYAYAELALQLQSDWRAAEQRRLFEAELARLRSRYDVRIEASGTERGPELAGDVR